MSEITLRQRALELYKPPFTFDYGYVRDSVHNVVADDHTEDSIEETGAPADLRVRGWGRLSYLPEPEALQDEVGKVLVEALNKFWVESGSKPDASADALLGELLAWIEELPAPTPGAAAKCLKIQNFLLNRSDPI